MRTARLLLPALVLVVVTSCHPAGLEVRPGQDGFRLLDGDHLIGVFAPYRSSTVRSHDSIRPLEPHVFEWQRTFTLTPGAGPQQVRLTMDFVAAHAGNYSMIPGVSYDGNHEDLGNVYCGFTQDGVPWSFAWHRTTIPGATYSEGNAYNCALFGVVDDPEVGLACSLLPEDATTTHRLIFPEEEMPGRILSKQTGIRPGRAQPFELVPGESFTATAYLLAHPVERPRTGYRHLLDFAWKLNHRPAVAHRSLEEVRDLGLRFIRESLWDEEQERFAVGLQSDGANWIKYDVFQIGWCGCNGALACYLLHDFLERGDDSSSEMAKRCLDAWLRLAPPSRTEVGTRLDLADYGSIATDANNLGAAVVQFLRAQRLAERCSFDGAAYRELALDICEAVLAIQASDGSFRHAIAERADIGACLLPALLAAHAATGDARYFASAVAANRHYMRRFLATGRLGGSALDTLCTDLESGFPLLESNILLYEITHDAEYLQFAEEIAYYCASWQIAQSVPAPAGSLMDRISYETFGTHTVSTEHICSHSFALSAVPYLIRLAEHTGNNLWRQRALAVWANSTRGISDGAHAFMDRGPRPAGAQDETYFHTDWFIEWASTGNLDQEEPRGAASQWLTAWNTAMRLDLLSDEALWSELSRVQVVRCEVAPALIGSRGD